MPTSPTDSRSWSDAVLWSVAETSAYLRVPAKTLYEWRYKGDGPPSHRVGRYVRYVPSEVHTWVCDQ
ncbi:helix-turn-helix domain-containing protein [Streptomonospora nanhaiensis]|uniref:Helix-turn-helix domain-containing protein n=1 Tax=Streptomonospora nanhaiensis TaxID=1323731 RepID=A0ABY6YMS8_9ACTN|nr:helix-turn-helix domain-containing protein [Streptomonospora nanhaiensis]WAE73662.1 helix-turn-helix domain-containing protein [Streptomonospora nanhaiensis]